MCANLTVMPSTECKQLYYTTLRMAALHNFGWSEQRDGKLSSHSHILFGKFWARFIKRKIEEEPNNEASFKNLRMLQTEL